MEEQELREIEVVFVKEFKFFIHSYDKKTKTDYILNVNKSIKEKFDEPFTTPNNIQAFILNYEIRKLLDKSINIKNQKYSKIIYLNSELTLSGIMNTCQFLNNQYEGIDFNYELLDPQDDFNTEDQERLSEFELEIKRGVE
jgi:hypothetical protein